jgi:hypothetical protein
MKTISVAATLVAFTIAGGAQGAVIFTENFDDDLGLGGSAINFNGFDQLTVTDGTVDLIGAGAFGITCETAACVDLSGTSFQGGTLTSEDFDFVADVTYTLTARVSGNQRVATSEVVQLGLTAGNFAEETFEINDGFADLSFVFTSMGDFTDSFFIRNLGSDNFGAILDSITLTSEGGPMVSPVPLPAGLPLMFIGIGGLSLLRRRTG